MSTDRIEINPNVMLGKPVIRGREWPSNWFYANWARGWRKRNCWTRIRK